MWRWIAGALIALVLTGVLVSGIAGLPRETGYFAPLFARDGRSVFAIRRVTAAATLGFGYEFWTPPATVFVRHDRYALVTIALSDHRLSVLGDLPPSPLAGQRLQAYHGAIFGSSSAHLRWDDGYLLYEVAVTRHDTPLARTFVARGRWDPAGHRFVETAAWRDTGSATGGDEPEQLSGRLEVIALPGAEGLPCGVVTLDRDTHAVTPLVMTSRCAMKFSNGISAGDVSARSRRADIERAATLRETYATLVARGIAGGANEGAAMLQANREMERLGYFPRSPTLSATTETCPADAPLFTIADEEFRVGLFQDIEQAITHPGEDMEKSSGDYVRHRAFDTSRQINEYLADRNHTAFFVRTSSGCWRITIDRHDRK